VVEHLASKYKTLNLKPQYHQKTKTKKTVPFIDFFGHSTQMTYFVIYFCPIFHFYCLDVKKHPY
jgi:hypothetical protein